MPAATIAIIYRNSKHFARARVTNPHGATPTAQITSGLVIHCAMLTDPSSTVIFSGRAFAWDATWKDDETDAITGAWTAEITAAEVGNLNTGWLKVEV